MSDDDLRNMDYYLYDLDDTKYNDLGKEAGIYLFHTRFSAGIFQS
jgi:hypothetical protein